MKITSKPKQYTHAHVITVDMGYGHQRAAHPLSHIAYRGIINANAYPGIPAADHKAWEGGRTIYEKISRMKHLPIVGDYIFGAMDYMQKIQPFYPKRDLSKPTSQLRQIYWMIRRGWGRDLIERLNKNPIPLISTFFTPAFFADEHGYKGEIFSITTDADVSRAWAPLRPKQSRIKYLVPNTRVKDRLQLYGVRGKNIFVTGFPLPKENIGDNNAEILKQDLGRRICNLDPKRIYHKKYDHTLHYYLGKQFCPVSKRKSVTIMFAVGGAGAQRELGREILFSLRKKLREKKIRLILVAGIRNGVAEYFKNAVFEARLKDELGRSVVIIHDNKKYHYFRKFNLALRTTDILWTKPSELVFYTALGVPIIIAPPIGSQENFNHDWLTSLGSGISQLDPKYTHEWLFDWVDSGWIAEAAMNGFLDASQMGTYNIEDVVLRRKRSEIHEVHLW